MNRLCLRIIMVLFAFLLASSAFGDTLKPGDPLPRNETLYFNGQQWGPVKWMESLLFQQQ